MKTEQKIPFAISEYIRDHFKEDFLFYVKDIRAVHGHQVYTVEVSKDNYIHQLKFNEDGTLVDERSAEAFPPDIHEEQTFGEVPE